MTRGLGVPGAALLLLAAFATPAPAEDGWRLDLGGGVSALLLDPSLADYRWEVGTTPALAVQAAAMRERWALGLGMRTTSTVQQTGIPGESAAPRVSLHSLELQASFRVLQWQGIQLWGQAHGGRMLMRYRPDQLLVAAPGGGEPILVQYAPVNEWTGGFATSLRREFFGNLALAAQFSHSSFALDTLHRRGDEIVEERRSFRNWSLGIQASWMLDL